MSSSTKPAWYNALNAGAQNEVDALAKDPRGEPLMDRVRWIFTGRKFTDDEFEQMELVLAHNHDLPNLAAALREAHTANAQS